MNTSNILLTEHVTAFSSQVFSDWLFPSFIYSSFIKINAIYFKRLTCLLRERHIYITFPVFLQDNGQSGGAVLSHLGPPT